MKKFISKKKIFFGSFNERAIYLNRHDPELVKIHKEYEDNFIKLQESVGTPQHEYFKKKEERLSEQCIKRQSKLGILIQDNKIEIPEKVKNRLKKARKVLTMVVFSSFWLISTAFALKTPNAIDRLLPVIAAAESSNNPLATGDGGNSRGLCQINKATWHRLSRYPWSDAYDPEKNLQVCRQRLEEIQELYSTHNLAELSYHYNAGDNSKLSFEKWKKNQPNLVYRSLYDRSI